MLSERPMIFGVALSFVIALPFDASAAARPRLDQLSEAADQLMTDWERPDKLACSVGVVVDGKLVFRRDFGFANLEHETPLTPRSRFSIASMSKQFTAFAVLLLAGDEKLSLDDDVRKHVPELPVYAADNPITIADLMHHTSGLRDYMTLADLAGVRPNQDFLSAADSLALIARQRQLTFSPGGRYQYQNTGYFLLALIVERVSGMSFKEFATQRIFEPLSMADTTVQDDMNEIIPNRVQGCTFKEQQGFILQEESYPTLGHAGVYTTVADLARWDLNFYDALVGGATLVRQMTTSGRTRDGEDVEYGGGLHLEEYKGLELIEHSGGQEGYFTQIQRFPDQKVSVILLCAGGRFIAPSARRIVRALADIYLADHIAEQAAAESPPANAQAEQTPEPPPAAEPAATPVELSVDALRSFIGRYSRAERGDIMEFSLKDAALAGSYTRPGAAKPAREFVLEAVGPAKFRVTNGSGHTFTFEPAAGPRARRVRIDMPGVPEPMSFDAFEPMSASDIGELEGRYYSDELDAVWELTLEAEGVSMTLPRQAGRKLFEDSYSYFGRGSFVSRSFSNRKLHLERRADGSVSGMTWIGNNRITLTFEKLPRDR